MRAAIILILFFSLLVLSAWITLSGAIFFFVGLFLLFLAVVSIGYTDTFVLYILGAREVRSSDEKEFSQAASQQAYKLAVKAPYLYFYNGSLERAFVLQSQKKISLVLNKSLLEKCTPEELEAICFELLLQSKKRMASKRTRAMFMLGLVSWLIHSVFGFFMMLIPVTEVKKASEWFLNYLIHPWLDVIFKFVLGDGYFKKLENSLNEFPEEKELLEKVGLKLSRPVSYHSLPSRKILEFSSISKSNHFQNMMALEFLPHEWDYLFKDMEMKRAQ